MNITYITLYSFISKPIGQFIPLVAGNRRGNFECQRTVLIYPCPVSRNLLISTVIEGMTNR